jgi:hypothetical protein
MPMTRTEAHTLLNAAKAGHPINQRDITAALMATGDLSSRAPTHQTGALPPIERGDPCESQVIKHKEAGTWESKNKGLAPAEWFEVIA